MDYALICGWLGLSPQDWPPDYYRLLGLEPGESDTARIEEQVHQRLEAVRRYQLTHPEQVTEAMNRLAQAFVCLTDPGAKRAYDAELFGKPLEPEVTPVPAAVAVPGQRGAVEWLPEAPEELVPLDAEIGSRPTPVAVAPEPTVPLADVPLVPLLPAEPVAVQALPAPQGTVETADEVPAAPPTIVIPDGLPAGAVPPPPPPPDPIAQEASSRPARRGLGTKRGLYRRIARTRKLLHAWEQAGKYLAQPQRRLTRPSEATELIQLLARIQALLVNFPPLLGAAGQPGYLVVTLARQATPVPTFQTLLPSQRQTLAQHWEAGHKLLKAHRQFLRQELRALRRKGPVRRSFRAARAFLREHPEYVLFAIALLAIVLALARF